MVLWKGSHLSKHKFELAKILSHSVFQGANAIFAGVDFGHGQLHCEATKFGGHRTNFPKFPMERSMSTSLVWMSKDGLIISMRSWAMVLLRSMMSNLAVEPIFALNLMLERPRSSLPWCILQQFLRYFFSRNVWLCG